MRPFDFEKGGGLEGNTGCGQKKVKLSGLHGRIYPGLQTGLRILMGGERQVLHGVKFLFLGMKRMTGKEV
jgi:hypothetical protein